MNSNKIIYIPTEETYKLNKENVELVTKINPGTYQVSKDMNGTHYLTKIMFKSDQLIRLPNTIMDKISQEIETFWSKDTQSKFKKYGLVYKRGIILHGLPGTGKTCSIVQISLDVVEKGGIVLFNPNPKELSVVAKFVRELQPDVPILVIWEEFENTIVGNPHALSLLDGEIQIDNVVYLGTTNYFTRLPANIINRPGRFASIYHADFPNAEVRKIYLNHKLVGDDKKQIDQIVDLTEGMSIDQLKDIIVSVFCLDIPLKDAANKIKMMTNSEIKHTSDFSDEEDFFEDETEELPSKAGVSVAYSLRPSKA